MTANITIAPAFLVTLARLVGSLATYERDQHDRDGYSRAAMADALAMAVLGKAAEMIASLLLYVRDDIDSRGRGTDNGPNAEALRVTVVRTLLEEIATAHFRTEGYVFGENIADGLDAAIKAASEAEDAYRMERARERLPEAADVSGMPND